MAGPTLVNVGGIINPHQDLQNAVSGVGQIYRGYEEDARKAAEATRRQAEYQAGVDERNRAKGLREYAANYDAKVGENYRGISGDIRPLVEQQEAAVRTRWQSANPNATAEQKAKLESDILDARRSLVSSEDVESAVATDLIKAGFSPSDVDAFSKYTAHGYSSRGAAYTNAKEQAKQYNDALDNRIKNAVDLAKLDSNSADARVGAIGRFAAASNNTGRSTADKSKGAKTGGFDVFDPADATAAKKFYTDTIGSGDAEAATVNMMAGWSQYNADQEKAGLPKLSSKDATAIALGDIDLGVFNDDVRFQSPEAFKVLLQQKQASANAKAEEAKGDVSSTETDKSTGRMTIQEYRNLVASQGGGASSNLRNAILNPAYMAVSYDQVNRQRVTSAYARLFPEAAKENGVVVPNPTTASTARTTTTNRKVAAPIDRSTAKPLPDLKQSGSGQVDLGESNTKETPAGSTASPDRQVVGEVPAVQDPRWLARQLEIKRAFEANKTAKERAIVTEAEDRRLKAEAKRLKTEDDQRRLKARQLQIIQDRQAAGANNPQPFLSNGWDRLYAKP